MEIPFKRLQSFKCKPQRGFTLIELLIVLTVIGVISSVAISSYQQYIARTQAIEGAVLLGGLRSPIKEAWMLTNVAPILTGDQSHSIHNVKLAGSYISSITDDAGVYTASFKNTEIFRGLQGKTIVMTFNTATEVFSFSCVGLPKDIRPSLCH